MGIFSFLKKKEEIIKFNQVESWINSYLKEKNLDKKLELFKQDLKINIEEVNILLQKLQDASLMNENIPERVKHIMQGNRENYIRKINLFIENINPPDEYLQIREFSKKITEDLDKLTGETQKSYFVLKEFLETELAGVAKKIKEIEKSAIKFRQDIEKENINKLEEMKQKVSDYHNSKETLANLKEQKEKQKEELEELKSKNKKTRKKIDELKQASGYKEYQSLTQAKKDSEKEEQAVRKEIITHFSTLEKAFKKYKRMSLDEKTIDKYLDNPADALLKDEEFKISIIMDKIIQSLDKLELKDKKAEKTKEEIRSLSRELLKNMQTHLQQTLEKQKENKKILLSNTSVMSITEQENWMENIEHRIKEKEQEIENTENYMDRINPRLIKQQVRDLLKEFSVIMDG